MADQSRLADADNFRDGHLAVGRSSNDHRGNSGLGSSNFLDVDPHSNTKELMNLNFIKDLTNLILEILPILPTIGALLIGLLGWRCFNCWHRRRGIKEERFQHVHSEK
jgi:hypothetical protein